MKRQVVGQIVRVELKRIRPYYEQPREHFDQARIEELAESIGEYGQQNPVLVREIKPDAEGRDLELVDGERRWRAMQWLGRAEIDAVITSTVGDDDEHFLRAVVANAAREDLSPAEVARAVARIAAMPGFRDCSTKGAQMMKLAKVFGHSVPWVERMLKISSLAPEAQSLVESGQLSTNVAVELAAIPTPERQAEVGKRIANSGLKNNRALGIVREAAKVEGVRREAAQDGADHFRGAQDTKLMTALIAQIGQTAESILDMPAKRLADAYGARPMELERARARVAEAISILEQLDQAMAKLAAR